ncbi:MAG: META domain-containing protein [Leifsonia sp.]
MPRHLLRGVIAAAALLATVTLAGCAGSVPTAANPVGAWGDAATPTEPSLLLSKDGSVSGTDGCNRLVGEWKGTDDGISFGPFASTRMFCEGVDTWLAAAASATVADDTMTVLDSKGKTIGTLKRDSANPAAESAVVIDALGVWDSGPAKPVSSLTLSDDGKLTGSDGCNTLSGSWTAKGNTVEFGQVAATMMFCEGVDTWLSGLASATVAGDTMKVLGADGTQIGILTRNAT